MTEEQRNVQAFRFILMVWLQLRGRASMHQAYQDLIVNRATQMVGAAKALKNINHSGLKGQLRELVARELLIPLLPPGYIVGQGEVVSSYGDTSNQIDAVIAHRGILPAMLIDQVSGIFPLEAVLMTIEVKSTLDAGELRTSDASAAKIARFPHAPPVGSTAFPPGHRIEHVVPYLLAFGTDLTPGGKSELERYGEISQSPSILGICVVERGFWFRDNGAWQEWKFQMPYGEVVAFVTAVVNTCQRIASTRFQPDMRSYIT
ncbi:MAG: DUF6602 domain-containing protein [Acetobacteraceae bacterium]